MKLQHKFYKYRTLYSSGPSSWQVTRLPHGETPKSFFDEMCREHDWSEHFRGIEWRKVKCPPKDWLLEEIASLKNRAEFMNNLAEDYIELLNNPPS